MVIALTLLACLLSAAAAVRARGLLTSSVFLAATSACLAVALYMLDAPYVAAIELSVGAGLVAVLFALGVVGAGGDSFRARPALPRLIAGVIAGVPVVLLAWLVVQSHAPSALPVPSELGFIQAMWSERSLDALGQVLLLFVCAVAVKVLVGGLPLETPHDETAAHDGSRKVVV